MTLTTVKQHLAARLAPLQAWYQSRERREQRVLQLLAVTLSLVLFYWLLWAPSVAARDQARARHQGHLQTLQWIEDNAPAVRAAAGQNNADAPTVPRDWIRNISRSADEYAVVLRGFTPEGNEAVRIQLENQPAQQTVLWLQSLQQQGLRITSVEMSPGDSPGTTTLRAAIQQ